LKSSPRVASLPKRPPQDRIAPPRPASEQPRRLTAASWSSTPRSSSLLRVVLLSAHCCSAQRLTAASPSSSASLLLLHTAAPHCCFLPSRCRRWRLPASSSFLRIRTFLGVTCPREPPQRPRPPPLPSRTNWTRLVRRPVLTGHVSSLARAPNAPPRLRATAPPRASSVRAHAPRAPRPAPRAPRWRRSPSGPASGRVPGPGQLWAWEESACKVALGGGGLGGRPPTPLPYLFPYRSPYCMPVAPRV